MEMSSEEKIFDKLDTLQKDISKMDKNIAVLMSREQPSAPCRAEIERRYCELNNKINGFQGGIGHSMNEKVSKSTFWKLIGSSFLFTSLSFGFTWIVYLLLREIK